jgi:hypothetical protein
MPSDLFLYRKDRRWQKVSSVTEVTMTSNQTAYASVTGASATDIVTVTGATLVDGQILTLTAKTGGSGVSVGVGYYIINASGATAELSLTPGGSVVALGTDITAGAAIVSQPELRVWSSEFRDTFSSSISLTNAESANATVVATSAVSGTASVPGVIGSLTAHSSWDATVNPATNTGTSTVSITTQSDEVAHQPLRQTSLARSFWKFDRGASVSPRYLYAEYLQGDQILDNPPETV